MERDAERERINEENRRREEENLRNRLRLKRCECLQLFGKRFYRHSCEDRKFSLFTMHVAEKNSLIEEDILKDFAQNIFYAR